ncbi:MAG TPA: endonuclease [Chloroflexota bacterium]|jgi:predicted GIY-YIG superfamily endonuclease
MAVEGTVYLIHLDQKLAHAGHYLGWAHTERLEARLVHHRKGSGARFMAAVSEAGIAWNVVRTWPGDRHLERSLKNRKGAARFCPTCKAAARAKSRIPTQEVNQT